MLQARFVCAQLGHHSTTVVLKIQYGWACSLVSIASRLQSPLIYSGASSCLNWRESCARSCTVLARPAIALRHIPFRHNRSPCRLLVWYCIVRVSSIDAQWWLWGLCHSRIRSPSMTERGKTRKYIFLAKQIISRHECAHCSNAWSPELQSSYIHTNIWGDSKLVSLVLKFAQNI